MDPRTQASATRLQASSTSFSVKDLMIKVLPGFLLGAGLGAVATRFVNACGDCTNCTGCTCSVCSDNQSHPCRITGTDSNRLEMVSNPGELASLKASLREALAIIEQKERNLPPLQSR